MTTSQNGWTASEDRSAIHITKMGVDGVEFVGGVRDGDVKTVLGYVAQQVNDRVEKAVDPGCWGYAFRANKNDPNSLSNHSSGTAIDYNAPKHNNGDPAGKSFSAKQIAEIHRILDEVDDLVRWGGDYQHTVDSMHFEINAGHDAIAALANRIRSSGAAGRALPKLPAVDLSNIADAARGSGQHLPGVKLVQTALNAELDLHLHVNGDFDDDTRKAYAKWQRKLGFRGDDADGVPGEESLMKLGVGQFRVNP